MVREDDESEGEKQLKKVKNGLITSPHSQPKIFEKRIKDLDQLLKEKFANKFKSVREAFLSVDADHDGLITIEDMLKHFKPEDGIDYDDLAKLMRDRDSKRQGNIGYTDFSKWLGGAIH
jgi:EF-hand domain pair